MSNYLPGNFYTAPHVHLFSSPMCSGLGKSGLGCPSCIFLPLLSFCHLPPGQKRLSTSRSTAIHAHLWGTGWGQKTVLYFLNSCRIQSKWLHLLVLYHKTFRWQCKKRKHLTMIYVPKAHAFSYVKNFSAIFLNRILPTFHSDSEIYFLSFPLLMCFSYQKYSFLAETVFAASV